MQNYVLRRCLRNRQALEEHYQLSLHSSRQQKWYQFLDNRDTGNKFLKALTEHMPKVTHSYMLHQVRNVKSVVTLFNTCFNYSFQNFLKIGTQCVHVACHQNHETL